MFLEVVLWHAEPALFGISLSSGESDTCTFFVDRERETSFVDRERETCWEEKDSRGSFLHVRFSGPVGVHGHEGVEPLGQYSGVESGATEGYQ